MTRRRRIVFSALATCLALTFLEGGARLLLPARYHQRLFSDVATLIAARVPVRLTAEQLAVIDGAVMPRHFSGDWRTVPVTSVGDPWGYPEMRIAFNQTGVRTNTRGYRGPDRIFDKAPGTMRILCLGDSVTFGYGVREGETFCDLLPAFLDSGVTIDTINAGIPGKTSRGGRVLLERDWLEYAPDIVLVQFMLNDIHYDLHDREHWPPMIVVWANFVLHRSALMNALADVLPHSSPATDAYGRTKPFSPVRFREYLETYIALGRSHNFRTVFVPTAMVYEFPALQEYTRVMRATAGETHAPFVDVDAALRAAAARTSGRAAFHARANYLDKWRIAGVTIAPLEELAPYYWMFVDPVHPDASGHRVISQAIAESVRPLTAPLREAGRSE